ncbi:MAG: ABC transporter permease, partial [Burkholderiales bacterium]|nr:ABC transporter permease [Burkholderiales bacterium]
LQTAIFPFAATLEVRHSSVAIYNEDNGAAARELVQRLAQAAAFSQVLMLHSEPDMRAALDSQRALLGIRFPADFSRRLLARQPAPVQIVVDGRRSNSGQIAAAYAAQVIAAYVAERGAIDAAGAGGAPASLNLRHLYNPNLDYKWHILPSLVAIITTIGCLIVTALSVAREREEGSFEQLLVSPLTPAYIMAGKAIPGMLVAFTQGSFIAVVAHWIYGVPFSGSLALLATGMLAYGLALAGIGLFISSLSFTQQQAFLGVFCFMVPAVILSGYVAPVENMPPLLQMIAHLNPLTYFIQILKGVFLRGYDFADAWPYLWPLLLIASASLSLALRLFRRHIA